MDGELELRDHRAAVLRVHRLDIGDVIGVAVGQEHEVDPRRVAQRVRDRRAGQPRVDQHVRPVGQRVAPGAVAIPGDLDAVRHREAPPRPFRPEHTSGVSMQRPERGGDLSCGCERRATLGTRARREHEAIRRDCRRGAARPRRRLRGARPRGRAVALHRRTLPTPVEVRIDDGPVVVASATVVPAPALTGAVARAILFEHDSLMFGRFVHGKGGSRPRGSSRASWTAEVRLAVWGVGWVAGAYRDRWQRHLAGEAVLDGDPVAGVAARRGAEQRVASTQSRVEPSCASATAASRSTRPGGTTARSARPGCSCPSATCWRRPRWC